MHKDINKFANTIYLKFKSDIAGFDKKIKDRWDREFNALDGAMNQKELFYATNSIFQFGAMYIRESERFEEFREMQHTLYDMVCDWSGEDDAN